MLSTLKPKTKNQRQGNSCQMGCTFKVLPRVSPPHSFFVSKINKKRIPVSIRVTTSSGPRYGVLEQGWTRRQAIKVRFLTPVNTIPNAYDPETTLSDCIWGDVLDKLVHFSVSSSGQYILDLWLRLTPRLPTLLPQVVEGSREWALFSGGIHRVADKVGFPAWVAEVVFQKYLLGRSFQRLDLFFCLGFLKHYPGIRPLSGKVHGYIRNTATFKRWNQMGFLVGIRTQVSIGGWCALWNFCQNTWLKFLLIIADHLWMVFHITPNGWWGLGSWVVFIFLFIHKTIQMRTPFQFVVCKLQGVINPNMNHRYLNFREWSLI